jgi:putative transposase
VVGISILGERLAPQLSAVIVLREKQCLIVRDHWTEFTSKAMLARIEEVGVPSHLVALGKPMHNSSCEAFNSKKQDEVLNETRINGLDHARAVDWEWVAGYNA